MKRRALLFGVLAAASLASARPSRAQTAAPDHRLRIGGGLSYTVGRYSEMEGMTRLLLPVGRRIALAADYATHAGNDRVSATATVRPAVRGRLQPYAGLGAYWLPPHAFAPETRRLGGLAAAGLELAMGHLDVFDGWLFVEGQLLTASAVRAPLLVGAQFTLRRRGAEVRGAE